MTMLKKSTNALKKVLKIEACKQWGVFKRRANELIELVQEHHHDDITIEFNKEKPRRGCFEVRLGKEKDDDNDDNDDDDMMIVSLQNLKRPFVALRELELEPLVTEILRKVGGC